MRLENRVSQLEARQKGMSGVLMAFIGVPEGGDDIFQVAQKFWDGERHHHPHGNIRLALPWPSYAGKEVKFLGLGTHDDLLFGYGGCVRSTRPQFVFLADVGHLIPRHFSEVKIVMDTHATKRDEMRISEEAIRIMLCMIGSPVEQTNASV